MATPESKVKDRVKKLLKTFGDDVYQFWPVQTGYGAPTLDCIGCFYGQFFAIETKAPGKHPTPRQELTMDSMWSAGAKVFVIGEAQVDDTYSGLGELRDWLDMIKATLGSP